MTRIIIAGSRDFNDYILMASVVSDIINIKNIKDDIEIVSGHAKGADALGERFANDRGYHLKIFPADWIKYKRSAGPIRNKQMAEYAAESERGILIAFPMGESRGTRNMIEEAKKLELEVHVIEV